MTFFKCQGYVNRDSFSKNKCQLFEIDDNLKCHEFVFYDNFSCQIYVNRDSFFRKLNVIVLLLTTFFSCQI